MNMFLTVNSKRGLWPIYVGISIKCGGGCSRGVLCMTNCQALETMSAFFHQYQETIWISSMSSSPSNHNQQHPCSQQTLQRQECHMHHGIQNEECIREELTEKRCLAELHCQREAANFYHRSSRASNRRWSCSALVERFCRRMMKK